ncbi:PREDICTED: flap endonuclease GEN-like 2 [Nelumbo nucifera]|uniref:Single-strand DNA endonuclease 1 n=1 Tax=Nelumbo nucifera TaxID=4432 RepID=A0A1U8B1Q3_NELNU|nr:PREDICTED: flap endonuclease GEN-like 2 [Nelumbo nucifera]XP_010273128.1 PREDICTED: flap endonuclease GEN-like 2 [Nelumbo nucifera]
MGVKNLWDILESCKKILPLHHLQNKRVCIDLSCWIVQLHNVCKSHSCIKDKVYLSALFHRLKALIALNCSLIFVTDGSIPAIKMSTYRRRLGSENEATRDEMNLQKVSSLPRNMGSEFSCMIKEAKVLGMALGIPCLDGLEEAEAQCALLDAESLCDGCFSTDSDIFLFGARTVYRDICLGEGGYVVCYEMVDIERKLGFGRNSLITLALLLGSDYSQGVHGFGRETACQIVKSVGDDSVLQRIASEGLAFAKKMRGPKKQSQALKCNTNQENDLVHNVNIASEKNQQWDNQFLQVIDAYLKPKCHSADSEAVHRVLGQYPFQRFKLHEICAQFFCWTPEKTDEYILPKIAERDLRRFANLRATSSELGVQLPLCELPVICPISAIIKHRRMRGRDYYEVTWEERDRLQTSIVPADLVESACPEKIVEFENRRALGKKKNHKPRSKKAGNSTAVSEIDQKLQNLLLDAEPGRNDICNAIVYYPQGCTSNVLPEVIDLSGSTQPEVIDLLQSNKPEVIDLLSPSPVKAGKRQEVIERQIDVICLSDSETDTSSLENEDEERGLSLFIANKKEDLPGFRD